MRYKVIKCLRKEGRNMGCSKDKVMGSFKRRKKVEKDRHK